MQAGKILLFPEVEFQSQGMVNKGTLIIMSYIRTAAFSRASFETTSTDSASSAGSVSADAVTPEGSASSCWGCASHGLGPSGGALVRLGY